MTRACLMGSMFLLIGCGNSTAVEGDGGIDDAGAMPDADLCDTIECECNTDGDCGLHEVCESSPDLGRVCACAPAYQDLGGGCQFAGAPLAPGFDDTGPWATSGGAVVDPGAAGSDDPGEAHWSGDAMCDSSRVSQTFAMPPLERAEPLAFAITYRGQNTVFEARPQVGINGYWARFPRRDAFFTQVSCLGEAGFGGEVRLWIDGNSSFCPSSDSSDQLIVDRFEIVRAEEAGLDCPMPGVVIDGDFEGEGTSWTPLGGASVQDGVGQGGTRAARLRTETLCSTAAMTGTLSLPLPSTMPSQAVRFYWSGTAGRSLQVLVADAFVAELSASGEGTVTSACLPPHTRGLARSITFSIPVTSGMCGDPDVRDFVIDSVEIVSEAKCGNDPFILDGDFELGVNGESSWRLSGGGPRGTIGVVTGVAQNGSAALRFTAQEQCAFLSARATMVVPEPDENGGPALKYFYRAGNNPETSLESRPGNGPLSEGAAGFVEETVCLAPALATKPQELVFTMQRSGPCGVAFPEEQAFVDHVRLTTDAACPTE